VNDISNFQHNVTTAVSQVSIPSCLLACGGTCHNIAHHHAISKYYSDLTTCVKTAVESSIPLSYIGSSKFNIPGWTDCVSDKHDMAKDVFLQWVVAGKPRSGLIYLHMYRTRASFKQAFWFCRKQNEQIKADACARSCMNNVTIQFWNNVSKMADKMLLLI